MNTHTCTWRHRTQAIFIDILLIIPGVIGGIGGMVAHNDELAAVGNTATFLSFFALLAYCIASSLLGAIPDKIPIVSEQVNIRVPSSKMFDEQGNYVGLNDDGADYTDGAAPGDENGDKQKNSTRDPRK